MLHASASAVLPLVERTASAPCAVHASHTRSVEGVDGDDHRPERRRGSIARMGARPISRRVVATTVVAVGAAVGGLALAAAATRDRPPPVAPHFVDDTASAGIDHRYDGEFEFFVGGGVAAFDCDDDGRPDLYLAGGREPAALYRNESDAGGALRFTPCRVGGHRPHRGHGRLPDRHRRRCPRRPRRPAPGGGRDPARSRGVPVRAGQRGPGHRRRRFLDRRVQRDVGGEQRPADAGVRRLPGAGIAARARTAGCSARRPTASGTRLRCRWHRATARCRSCSATGSARAGTTCA